MCSNSVGVPAELEEVGEPDEIGLDERLRVDHRVADARLGGEVEHRPDSLAGEGGP